LIAIRLSLNTMYLDRRKLRFHILMTDKDDWMRQMIRFSDTVDQMPGFEISLKDTTVQVTTDSAGKPAFPLVEWRFILFRDPTSLCLSTMLPIQITNMVTIATFLIDVHEYEARLAHIVAVLLALFAFLVYSSSFIPSLPRLTFMDEITLMAIFTVFLALAETVLLRVMQLWDIKKGEVIIRWTVAPLSILLVFRDVCRIFVEYRTFSANEKKHKEAMSKFWEDQLTEEKKTESADRHKIRREEPVCGAFKQIYPPNNYNGDIIKDHLNIEGKTTMLKPDEAVKMNQKALKALQDEAL
jgi:hypothetical protein